jgi:hypothetical protein
MHTYEVIYEVCIHDFRRKLNAKLHLNNESTDKSVSAECHKMILIRKQKETFKNMFLGLCESKTVIQNRVPLVKVK